MNSANSGGPRRPRRAAPPQETIHHQSPIDNDHQLSQSTISNQPSQSAITISYHNQQSQSAITISNHNQQSKANQQSPIHQ
jgi:hypothetical protein